MSPDRQRYRDTRDLVEDSIEILARHRGKWLGDDLAAIGLLVSLVDEAERQLSERVTTARSNDHSWVDIANALGGIPTEVRMRFDGRSPVDRNWLHGQ